MKDFRLVWNKRVRYLLKPVACLPALGVWYLIFNFSAQGGDVSGQLSGSVTTDLVEFCSQICDQGWNAQQILH